MPRPTIIPVVLSGGSGTRLWPASRQMRPKQLLALTGDQTMIRSTIDRLDALDDIGAPIIVTGVAMAQQVRRALHPADEGGVTLILEPLGRNTAPAVAIAALQILDSGDDALMLVLPADHVIEDVDLFAAAVETAASVGGDGHLVTFGIEAKTPETGFGYIRAGSLIADGVWAIGEFKEKPDAATAAEYVESGDYSWNSGMFLFLASRFLEELETHRPDIANAARRAFENANRTTGLVELHEAEFAACPAESIDFAVMEPTHRGAVIPVEPGWSDVGSWASLWELADKDTDGNVAVGNTVLASTTNSYVRSSGRVVAVAGLDGVVVVDSDDAVLVTSLEAAQQVKHIVDELRRRGDVTAERDGVSFDTWGTSRVLSDIPGLSVTEMTIDPGQTVPLPAKGISHVQIADGTGELIGDGPATDLQPGMSVFVPSSAGASVRSSQASILRIVVIIVDTGIEPSELVSYLERNQNP